MGRVVAIQVLFAFDLQYKNNRARQLIADAWMIRALLENKVDDLVMLLEKSEDNNDDCENTNLLETKKNGFISIINGNSQTFSIDAPIGYDNENTFAENLPSNESHSANFRRYYFSQ